jgi:hypothetical protein
MRDLWDFVVKNKEMLTWIGGGIAAIAGAVWTIIAHFLPARESKSKNGAGMSVMQSGTGIASGRDTVISGGEINIGLDATRVGEQAYRAALGERTRERLPLDWAATQNNLGDALRALGERESGTAPLEGAVVAYRASLSVDAYFNDGTRESLARVEALLAQRRAP